MAGKPLAEAVGGGEHLLALASDVGTPPEGWEVKPGEANEILVRSPDVFDGYWANDAATREAKYAGWKTAVRKLLA